MNLEGDAATGVQILRRALEEPLRQIAANAGQDGAVVVQMVRQAQAGKNNMRIGYNVLTKRPRIWSRRAIDPAKVTRSALENAASIAAMILTTEALITDLPEKERPAAPQCLSTRPASLPRQTQAKCRGRVQLGAPSLGEGGGVQRIAAERGFRCSWRRR